MQSIEEPIQVSQPEAERQALVERILASASFVRSPKLSAFLAYICEQDRLGRSHLINEQRIGVAVFGRPSGYNPGDDSIVRSQARFLRQRLEEFFTQEGRDEPLILYIPRGSYLPAWQARKTEAPPEPEIVEEAAQLPFYRRIPLLSSWKPGRRWLLAGVSILVIALVALAANRERLPGLTLSPENNTQRFWNDLLDARRTPIVVPSDSNLVLLQKLAERNIPLQDYMNRRYIGDAPSPALAGLWHNLANSQYTNVADLNLVFRLEQLPAAANSHMRIRYARSLALNELKESNAILVGSHRSNPWVELYAPFLRTDVGYDPEKKENYVRNLAPGAGEQSYFTESSSDVQHTAYGLVARVPGLDGQGTALLVGGTSKAGTEAAAEFLLSQAFTEFLNRFGRKAPLPHFEILISTDNFNSEAGNGKIVYSHILK